MDDVTFSRSRHCGASRVFLIGDRERSNRIGQTKFSLIWHEDQQLSLSLSLITDHELRTGGEICYQRLPCWALKKNAFSNVFYSLNNDFLTFKPFYSCENTFVAFSFKFSFRTQGTATPLCGVHAENPIIFNLCSFYVVKMHSNDGFRLNNASKTFYCRASMDNLKEISLL